MKLKCFETPLFFYVACAILPPVFAAPVVTSVMNAASNIDPRMPNASLVPGSIFIVKGTGLGPANIAFAPAAFQSTTLSGTSVHLTVNGTSVDALMYYTSATQIAALLPSNTPTGGSATITVTYNGEAGASTPFRGVVANNLGLFTVDSSGTGPAIVTFPDYSLVSSSKAANCGGPNTTCGAANPGDTLLLWATGLGAVAGDDASGAGLGQNRPDIPLKVWLGGVEAPVVYQGRSGCCIGEDQIVFTVPDNVPAGCAVPLVVQINNQVSNSTLMPVANGSRTCALADPAFAGVNLQQLAAQGSFNLGGIELDHFSTNNSTGFFDQAKFNFIKVSQIPPASAPFLSTYLDNQPLGTCTVIGSKSPGDLFFNHLNLALIDGGTSFTVTGPKGSMTVMANSDDKPTMLSPDGTFLVPGDYTITGGPGQDVGAFTAHIAVPAPVRLTNPASPNGFTVTRAQGLTIGWNPNGSAGHAEMVLSSAAAQNIVAQAVCTAPAGAGTFTIPPYVLLALPPGNGTNFRFQPGDQGPASSAAFSATGLDFGVAQSFADAAVLGGFPLN